MGALAWSALKTQSASTSNGPPMIPRGATGLIAGNHSEREALQVAMKEEEQFPESFKRPFQASSVKERKSIVDFRDDDEEVFEEEWDRRRTARLSDGRREHHWGN